MKSPIIMVAVACLTLSSQAQTNKTDAEDSRLKKEITVDRKIVPQLREAKRLSMTPSVELPTTQATKLAYSTRTVTTRVPALFSQLSPAAYADSIATDRSRGYLTLGYGPTFNALVSGGIGLINTGDTKLGAWIQYDGYMFHDDVYSDYYQIELKPLFRRNTFAGGIDLSQATGRNSMLEIGLEYGFEKHNSVDISPRWYDSYMDPETGTIGHAHVTTVRNHVNRFDGRAKFSAVTGSALHYSIGASYKIFANGNFRNMTADKEHLYGIGGTLETNPGYESQGILKISYTAKHDSNTPYEFRGDEWGYLTRDEGYTQSLVTLMPTYRYNGEQFEADLGLRIDLSHNSGKAVHIAPNVKIAWLPADQFTLWAKAGGGEVQNTLLSLYSFTPYLDPVRSYGNSHVPVTLEGGVTVGPFSGGYVKLFGGWAKANDWLVANYYSVLSSGYNLRAIDMSGYHAGIAAGYKYRNLVEAEVSAEIAPQEEDKGWYLWRDRAKRVINASIKLHPMEQLDINLGWEMRGGRITGDKYAVDPSMDIDRGGTWRLKDFSTLSSLNAGASWRVNTKLSVFADLQNLLNHKNVYYLGEGARGIHGMVGASLKF